MSKVSLRNHVTFQRTSWSNGNDLSLDWAAVTQVNVSVKTVKWGFPGGTVVENLPANAGDAGSSPGLGGSHMPRSKQAREPQLLSLRVWSLCSTTREATTVRGLHTAMKSGPRSQQLEKALAQKRRPNTAKNRLKKKTVKCTRKKRCVYETMQVKKKTKLFLGFITLEQVTFPFLALSFLIFRKGIISHSERIQLVLKEIRSIKYLEQFLHSQLPILDPLYINPRHFSNLSES